MASGFLIGIAFAAAGLAADEAPATVDEARMLTGYREAIVKLTEQIADNPENVDLYSRRGDARFFTADFSGAVADYDSMLKLDDSLKSSHWRRGIALFYDKKYEAAAAQFEAYHSFDNVDRENGIWRFLCVYKARGAAAARETLLKYEKDDREPFPVIYRLFEGSLTTRQLQDEFAARELTPAQRMQQSFYIDLYVGLFEDVEGRPETALPALKRAAANTWAPRAGYGPHYMWQVGRLHRDLLTARKERP
jgi:lipoprotein NlpI